MTDLIGLQAIGKSVGQTKPIQQKLKPPEPIIQQYKQSDQGSQIKQYNMNKLNMSGSKTKKKQISTPPQQITKEKKYQEEKEEKNEDYRDLLQNENSKSQIKSGAGFRMPEEYFDKLESKKQTVKQSDQQMKKIKEDINGKKEIMKIIGIEENDLNEFFDIMDDRVYDKKQPEEINNLLGNQIENKLQNHYSHKSELLQKAAELEAKKAQLLQEKQKIQDRLYQKKGLQSAIKEDQNEYLEQYIYPKQFENIDENEENKNDIKIMWEKETVNDILNSGQTDYEVVQGLRQKNQERLKEMEYAYYKNLRETQTKDEEYKQKQSKIDQGIVIKPLNQKQKEYKEFEDQFKNYIKQRRQRDERVNIQKSVEKKEFDLYQSTSPDPNRKGGEPKAPFRENVSSLANDDERRKIRLEPHIKERAEQLGVSPGQLVQTLNTSSMAQSKLIETNKSSEKIRQQSKSVDKNRKSTDKLRVQSTDKVRGASTENEFRMIQVIFEILDENKTGRIEKAQLSKYLSSKNDILELYTIDKNNLTKEINEFKSKQKNEMTIEEFTKFLKKPRTQKIEIKDENYYANEIRKSRKEQQQQEAQTVIGSSLLSLQQLQIFKNIFDEVDKEKDYVVLRTQLVQAFRNNINVIKILHVPAVYLQSIDKQLTVERKIEKEELIGNEEEKKQKEYITWNQVFEYFTDIQNASKHEIGQQEQVKQFKIYSSIVNKYFQSNQIKRTDDQNEIDISLNARQLLRRVFDEQQKEQNIYVKLVQFIDSVKNDKEFPSLDRTLGRKKADKFDLEEECIGDVLSRMEIEADEYVEWDEILEYFTRRGRPQHYEDQKLQKEIGKVPKIISKGEEFDQFVKKSKVRFYDEQNFHKEEVVDAYDSDPEIHIFGRDSQHKEKSNYFLSDQSGFPRNLSAQKSKQLDDFDRDGFLSSSQKFDELDLSKSIGSFKQKNSIENICQNDKREQNNNENNDNDQKVHDSKFFSSQDHFRKRALSESKFEFQLTVPQPYKFDEREKKRQMSTSIRQSKLQTMQEEIKEKNDFSKKIFKANKVPSHVKDRNLYEKIQKEQEQRRKEVKENSLAITISREKPFSFYERDKEQQKLKKKDKNQREEFVFKANEVPWFCQVNLWEKIENEEAIKRQERVAKESNKLMNMSKLPPRMELWEQEKRAKEMEKGMSQTYDIVESKFKANKVPDFEKLHSQFQSQLDQKKDNKKMTVPIEFQFEKSKKQPRRDFMDTENIQMKIQKEKPEIDKLEEAKKWRTQKPDYAPQSTKKFDDYISFQKKEQEKKRKDEEEEIKKLEKKQKRIDRLKPRVQKSEALQLDKQKRKEEDEKKKEKAEKDFINDTLKRKKDILNDRKRGREQPLLIERIPKRQQQLQKLRSVNKMLEICEQNGVKPQDLKNMFSKEEMNMVEDLKFLKKQYPKQFQKEILDKKNEENEENEDLNKIFEDDFEEDEGKKKKNEKEQEQISGPQAETLNKFIEIYVKNKTYVPPDQFSIQELAYIKKYHPDYHNEIYRKNKD